MEKWITGGWSLVIPSNGIYPVFFNKRYQFPGGPRMSWQFTASAGSILIGGIILGFIGIWVWRRNPVAGAKPFSLMMLAAAEWSFGNGLEMASVSLSDKIIFIKTGYLGISAIPLTWFCFVFHYTNREKWLTRRNLMLIMLIPVFTVLLAWTNDIHELVWKNIRLDPDNAFSMIATHGVWFWIHVIYSYILLLTGTLLFIRSLFRSPCLLRCQNSALLVGIFSPWAGHLLFLSGIKPYSHLNLTQFGFIITGLVMMLGIFRYRLFDIFPVASNRIIEHMDDSIMILNYQGEIVNCNPAAESQFAFPRNGVVGRPIILLLPNWPALAKSCQKNGSLNTEVKLNINKQHLIFNLSVSPFDDRRRRPMGYITIWRDITEIKQAEKAVQLSRERYRSMIQSVKDAIISADSHGRIVSWNNGAEKIFGYEKKEILGRQVDLLMPDRYKQKHRKGMEQVRSGGKTRVIGETVELEGKRKNGNIFPIELSLAYWKMDDNIFFTAIIRDISIRKQAEDKLKETVERFKSLTNRLHVGYYRNTPGPKGKFIEANRSILKMFGYKSMEKFLNVPVSDLYLFSDKRQKISQEIVRKGVIKNKRIRLKRKDGTPLIGSVSARSVKNEKGEIAYFDGIIEDVTERIAAKKKIRELKRQMIQTQKMEAIGTLAGGIAHDFNNILSAIIGYTELALFDTEADSHLHKSLTQSLQAANRATDLIKQILTFSRQAEYKIKSIYVNPLVKEALKMLRSTIPSSVQIKENIASKRLTIKADPTQIHQVVINLVTNASHAVNVDSGVIKVTLKEFVQDKRKTDNYDDIAPGRYARLTVSDNGTGISKENIDHIFDPYFTTKEKYKGTGLGLSVVFGIVETCNGYIKVDSEVNQGTTFDVYFPIVDQKAVNISADRRSDLPTGRGHILFVDDEPDIMAIQKQFLQQLGYTVTCPTCSTKALEMFRSKPDKFDLIISDMTMPDLTGDKLAQKIKKIRPDIPIILCTGFSEKLNKQQTCQIFFDKILMKPVDIAQMASSIREVIHTSANISGNSPSV